MQKTTVWVFGAMVFMTANWPLQFRCDEPSVTEHLYTYQLLHDELCLEIIRDSTLYVEGWDTLVQPVFWRKAMQLPPDSLIINVAKSRQIIEIWAYENWMKKTNKQKGAYEDSVRKQHDLTVKDELYYTFGRNHFYQFHKVMPAIDEAIEIFQEEQTDPWYAQSILLIESPGRLQYSTDGAYGAFQLMKGVAKEVGLVVNDSIDERQDFEKSAIGAARLIRTVCLPHTRAICQKYGLSYQENDLWFRLLVMHVYHAGARNVQRVLRKINPKEGGPQLIHELWQTKGRRFGNASQNYTQITIASLLELDQLIQREGIICPLNGDSVP